MANDTIQLKVSLQLVQESVKALRNQLTGIKPESSLFKGMSAALTKIEAQAERLGVKLKQPIKSQSDLSSLEKSYRELFARLQVEAGKLQSVKFGDVIATSDQQKQLDSYIQKIAELKRSLTDIYKNRVGGLVDEKKVDLKSLFDNTAKGAKRSYADELKNARSYNDFIATLTKRLKEAQEEQNKLNQLSAAMTEKDGKYSFKPGKKDEMNTMFGQTGLTANELINKVAGGNLSNYQQKINDVINALQTLQAQSNTINPNIIKPEVSALIKETEQDLQNFKNTLVSAAQMKGIEARNIVDTNAKVSLQDLNNQIAETQKQLTTFQTIEKTTNKIKNLIGVYVSWGAAVRTSIQQVRKAIQEIKQLDKTITSIAVVTNMSQEELWGQLDQYADIAMKYGATIEGAYQVSQIFY